MNKNRIEIPSSLQHTRRVSTAIEKFLKEKRVNNSLLFDIRLCVEEAVKNAIIHGNRMDPRLKVTVDYWMENSSFNISVMDEGRGFDVDNIPDPTDERNLLKAGGRGVYLIKNLMDNVFYRENKLVMTKNLN